MFLWKRSDVLTEEPVVVVVVAAAALVVVVLRKGEDHFVFCTSKLVRRMAYVVTAAAVPEA